MMRKERYGHPAPRADYNRAGRTTGERTGVLMILCATLNWGFGYLIIHDAASKMPLNALMFSRYLIASGVLILIFRKRFADLDLSRLCKGGVLGFLIFTGQYLQTSALSCQGITPGETAFITTLYTVCVPVMNVLFFHACWSAANIVSVMLSVPGLLLLNGNGTLGFGTGQVLALLGMLAFSGHILTASMFTKEEDVIVLTTVQFGTAALLSLALSVLRPGHTRLVWSGYAIAVLLYLGVLNTMAGFLLQFFGQQKLSAEKTSFLLSTESLFGMIISAFSGREHLSVVNLLGCILLTTAILISVRHGN